MTLYTAADRMLQRFWDRDGLTVTYTQNEAAIEIRAVQAETEYLRVQQGDGHVGVSRNTTDWVLRRRDLPAEPTKYDTITANGVVWKVQGDTARECWQYLGPGTDLIRVHCKR